MTITQIWHGIVGFDIPLTYYRWHFRDYLSGQSPGYMNFILGLPFPRRLGFPDVFIPGTENVQIPSQTEIAFTITVLREARVQCTVRACLPS